MDKDRITRRLVKSGCLFFFDAIKTLFLDGGRIINDQTFSN